MFGLRRWSDYLSAAVDGLALARFGPAPTVAGWLASHEAPPSEPALPDGDRSADRDTPLSRQIEMSAEPA